MIEPGTEAEVAAAVRDAGGPLRVRGGGTRGGAAGEGCVLSTAGLSGIVLHEPGALTLVARAGTPMAEVEAALSAHGQCLAFEPMDHRALLGTEGEPTIGGAVATGASGPRRIRAGACRDSLIGVRFVDGEGRVIRSGGRVMKNVTGYDLARLMAGARGTLGVLTEVAFKVLPAPAGQATLRVEGLDVARSVAAMAAALSSPFEVTGAARDPGGATHLRIEGLADSVAYRAGRLAEVLAPFGTVRVEEDRDASAATWAGVRDARPVTGEGDIWRVSVKPSDAPAMLEAVAHEAAMLDWGGGLVWLRTLPGTDVRGTLAVPGHAVLVRGEGPMLHPPTPGIDRLETGLRARFDPKGLFRGRATEAAAWA